MMPMPIPYVPIPGCPLPPPPPPPRPQHPTLWPGDTYTREEVDGKDARTLADAKKYVDEHAAESIAAAVAETVEATGRAAEEAAASARSASADAVAAATAAARAKGAAAAEVAGARQVVESADGKKSVTVSNRGTPVLRGEKILVLLLDQVEHVLHRGVGGDGSEWWTEAGVSPPRAKRDGETQEEYVAQLPVPSVNKFTQPTTDLFAYVLRNGVKTECKLAGYSVSLDYGAGEIRTQEYNYTVVGTWKHYGHDSSALVSREELRVLANGCSSASDLLTALKNFAEPVDPAEPGSDSDSD